MQDKQTAPYGSWQSPITPQLITRAAPRLDQPQVDGEDLYWLESRPWENGRTVVMRRRADGAIEDALPAPLGARSRVHEYGGAPYLVAGGILYFCLDGDQRIYRLSLTRAGALPEPLTPDNQQLRYADLCLDSRHGQLICVCEAHTGAGPEPANSLVAVPLDGSQQLARLASGADFYANPRISPDGGQLSWLCWRHPQMPWNGTELWRADFWGGVPSNSRKVAGGDSESIFQPQWSPDGELFFVSDRSNWWNIYRLRSSGDSMAICPMAAEFATPQWLFGMSTYGFLDSRTLACCYTQNGLWRLATIATDSGQLTHIDSPYSDISALHCSHGQAFFIAGSASSAAALATLENRRVRPVYGAQQLPFSSAYLAPPTAISFPTSNRGDDERAVAHAIYYRPTNPEFQAPPDELPPLLVMCHGGPTGSASAALNFKIQFWTSRGFAVLDVNYRGSTGYGRRYRDALTGNWGLSDVDDVVYGANHLARQGLVDGQRMAIRGSSAGGYTVLAALTRHDIFKAGASLYGIGDLEMLAADTHKFEARYTDTLVGPYPQARQTYIDRSPIHQIEQLDSPVIFLQGLDDKVVPPSQAEAMVSALNRRRVPVAYVPFTGEGHGFRKADNIIRACLAELYFYSRVFGFQPADAVEPVYIKNLG